MLDPTLISIPLGILAVLGTLGGVFLANRHATKLEELRIAHEKLKRNEEKIEEIYTLLIQINKWVQDVDDDMLTALSEIDPRYDLKATRYNEIKPTVDRVTTLIRLYIRSVLKEANNFFEDFAILRDRYAWLFITSTRENFDKQEAHANLAKGVSDFEACYNTLMTSLEKLVR